VTPVLLRTALRYMRLPDPDESEKDPGLLEAAVFGLMAFAGLLLGAALA
jgi:hypothetical protein